MLAAQATPHQVSMIVTWFPAQKYAARPAGLYTRKPNQALEPTRTSVTGRAGARPAPAARVAHL